RVKRDVEAACPCVVQRDFHRGLRIEVGGHMVGDVPHERLDPVDGPVDQHRHHVGVDGDLHRFHGFATPPWAARHHALADTDHATSGVDGDVEDWLGVDGDAGEFVWAAQGNVQDHRF